MASEELHKARIALLPFALNSNSELKSYWGEGIAVEIIDGLSQNPNLQVIAKRSTLQYTDRSTPIEDIAQALNADYLIDGEINATLDKIKVSANLIDAKGSANLWSKHFFFDANSFSEKDLYLVTQTLYNQLQPQKTDSSVSLAPFDGTENRLAYENFLSGQQALQRRTTSSIAQAQHLFEKAIDIDPDFVKAKAYLYFTHWYKVELLGKTYKQIYPELAPLYREFAAPVSQLPEVYAAKGLYMIFEGNFQLAETLTQAALEQHPSNTLYLDQMSLIYFYQGKFS